MERSAQAYDLMREVRRNCAANCEDLCKIALVAIRDVLVVHICCGMGDTGFMSALEHVFGRQIDDELSSQFHLARANICRMGRDRSTFDRAFIRIFGSSPAAQYLDYVFNSYTACAILADAAAGPHPPPKHRRNLTKKLQAVEQEAIESWRLSTASLHVDFFRDINAGPTQVLFLGTSQGEVSWET